MESIFKQFEAQFLQALPPGSSLKYRGSLARGFKGPHKTMDGAVQFFNPESWDCDLFVEVSEQEWTNLAAVIENPELANKGKVQLKEVEKWIYYKNLNALMIQFQTALKAIRGYNGVPKKVDLVIQTTTKSVNQLKSGILYEKGSFEQAKLHKTEQAMPLVWEKGVQKRKAEEKHIKLL